MTITNDAEYQAALQRLEDLADCLEATPEEQELIKVQLAIEVGESKMRMARNDKKPGNPFRSAGQSGLRGIAPRGGSHSTSRQQFAGRISAEAEASIFSLDRLAIISFSEPCPNP